MACMFATNENRRSSVMSTRSRKSFSWNIFADDSIRLNEELKSKINYIIHNRIEFYASLFIQRLLIARARAQFAPLCTPNVRPLMKAYWTEHREVTKILEHAHQQLDHNIQNIPVKVDYCAQMDELESKLATLNQLIKQQFDELSTLKCASSSDITECHF